MKRKAVLSVVIVVLLFSVLFSVEREGAKAANATGVVTASSLRVRTGAGTNYAILKQNNAEVLLPNGTKVTVLEKLTGWYKVSFSYKNETLTGYVSADYVALEVVSTAEPSKTETPSSGNKTTYRTETVYKDIKVPASVLKRAPLYKKDGKTRYQVSKKKMSLERGTRVTIIGEKKISDKKWFHISFLEKKKLRKAYVRNHYVKMTCRSAAPAQIQKKNLKVRKQKGKAGAYKKSGGKVVCLAKGSACTIQKDVLSDRARWYKISFVYGKKALTGYVNSKYVKLIKKVVTKKVPAVALSDAEFEKMMTAQKFPESYKESLRALHHMYPYWQFQSFQTGLDWNTVIKNESKTGVNLISNAKSAAWKSTASDAYDAKTGKWKVFDGKSWVAASQAAVCYYMDPRNFMNDRSVYMFELLGYQTQYQTKEGVNTILSNTPFYNKKFSYKDLVSGQAKNMYYVDAFMAAAKETQVSPYHLASRVKQEVVTSPTTTSTAVTGTVSGYQGIYNFYNIGATSSSQPVLNGLKWAANTSAGTYLRPWTDPYRSIVGGARYISQGYISKGQNTGYLEKFNVTVYQRYNHQYMTNVEAAYEEALKTKKAYAGMMDSSPLVFSIPVYQNMPEKSCEIPQ